MNIASFLRKNWKLILLILLFGLSIYSTHLYLTVGQRGYDKVLSSLATQFIKGKLALPIFNLPLRDFSVYNNNFYVYFGPLSSILLIPGAFFMGDNFPQVSLGVLSMVISFIAIYLISRKFNFHKLDSLFLSLFFVFSTVLFASSVINITAYQVEALGVPFILLSIWAYLYKKNPVFIGLFIGLAAMTRVTLVLATFFFFLEFIRKKMSIGQFILLLIPLVFCLSLLGFYNYKRFNSVFETGYNYNISRSDDPIGKNSEKYGEISITHIPANLYSFLIMAPEPLLADKDNGFMLRFPYVKFSPWGLAIWFSSPLFLFLITRFKRGQYSLSAGLTAFMLSIPVFTWYSIGYAQTGYRYALDFLPFLFLLLIPSLMPKLTRTAIVLILIGVVFNCIYITSIWEIYPLLNIYP